MHRAIGGDLRFDFIESTVSIVEQGSLTTLKGRGRSEPAHDHFHFHFLPRAPFSDEQRRRLHDEPGRRFHLFGTERGSASWTATAATLRVVKGAQGPALHADVPEWTREDGRSVHASFSRLVIPGPCGYPVIEQNTPGGEARTAAVNCAGIRIDFRDHGHYTEICANGPSDAPEHLADAIAATLREMLDHAVRWIYREQHLNSRRRISVRSNAVQEMIPRSDKPVPGYEQFWKTYAQKLARAL